jgi:hypothetical protein
VPGCVDTSLAGSCVGLGRELQRRRVISREVQRRRVRSGGAAADYCCRRGRSDISSALGRAAAVIRALSRNRTQCRRSADTSRPLRSHTATVGGLQPRDARQHSAGKLHGAHGALQRRAGADQLRRGDTISGKSMWACNLSLFAGLVVLQAAAQSDADQPADCPWCTDFPCCGDRPSTCTCETLSADDFCSVHGACFLSADRYSTESELSDLNDALNSVSVSGADIEALMDIKAGGIAYNRYIGFSTLNSQLTTMRTWTRGTHPCDSDSYNDTTAGWLGVSCDVLHGRVIALQLSIMFGSTPDSEVNQEDPNRRELETAFGGDLELLAPLTALESLELSGQIYVTGNIAILATLHEIKRLNFDEVPVAGDIAVLSGLTHLQMLILTESNVFGDPSALSGLPQLFELDVQDTMIAGRVDNLAAWPRFTPCSEYASSCLRAGLAVQPGADHIAGMDQCACCVGSPIVRSNSTGLCSHCAAMGEHFNDGKCITCPSVERCHAGVCTIQSKSQGVGCARCVDGYFDMGEYCDECPTQIIFRYVMVLVGFILVLAIVWTISDASADQFQGHAEDGHDVAALTREANQTVMRISNNATVCSIALPNLFHISIVFSIPQFPLPNMLKDIMKWVAASISLDFGSVGSTECSVAKGNGSAITSGLAFFHVKLVLTNVVFIALCACLTVPEMTTCCRRSKRRTRHAINARTAMYTLALPSLTRSWVKAMDCTKSPDGRYLLDALPVQECNPADEDFRGIFFIGISMALTWAVLVPAKLFHAVHSSAADGVWAVEELEAHAWILLKYKPTRWWFVGPLPSPPPPPLAIMILPTCTKRA